MKYTMSSNSSNNKLKAELQINSDSVYQLLSQMEQFAAVHKVPIINENGRKVFIEILKKHCPHEILEIGTAIGYSALLSFVYGADDVRITSLELSPERAAQAQSFIKKSPYADRLKIILGDASENLLQLPSAQKFDMIFIDAAKGQYLDYFHKVLPHLADGGIIVADNVLFRGYVKSEAKPPRRYKTIVKRLREYLAYVDDKKNFTTKIYENGDGLAVTKRLLNND